jgi:hypothetical protein
VHDESGAPEAAFFFFTAPRLGTALAAGRDVALVASPLLDSPRPVPHPTPYPQARSVRSQMPLSSPRPAHPPVAPPSRRIAC